MTRKDPLMLRLAIGCLAAALLIVPTVRNFPKVSTNERTPHSNRSRRHSGYRVLAISCRYRRDRRASPYWLASHDARSTMLDNAVCCVHESRYAMNGYPPNALNGVYTLPQPTHEQYTLFYAGFVFGFMSAIALYFLIEWLSKTEPLEPPTGEHK